jgi:AcrR family transcriptional regulator
LSAAAGGSTQLMYTLFGGKHSLANALYAEAHSRLARHMDDAGFLSFEPADPIGCWPRTGAIGTSRPPSRGSSR